MVNALCYKKEYKKIKRELDEQIKNNSLFQKHSGVYVCRSCGKQTRETGSGESSSLLCNICFNAGGLENEHNDYGHKIPVKGCPLCVEVVA